MENTELQPSENPQELRNAALLFAKALGLILQDGEGIVLDITENIKMPDDVKKVIVFKYDSQIHIYKCEEDLDEGTTVNMQNNPTSDNSEETNA